MINFALKISPLAGVDEYCPEDACVIDIGGTERLHGSEKKLLLKIAAAFKKINLQAKLAIAPTIGAAHALAKYGSTNLISVDQEGLEERLPFLPLQALRLSAETVQALQQVGLYYINDLLKLSRDSLALRFGSEVCTRLDQALGYGTEALQCLHPNAPLIVRKRFEVPLTQIESIKQACLRLLERLFLLLKAVKKKAGIFQIELECRSETGLKSTTRKELSLHYAVQDLYQARLLSALTPILENMELSGAVSQIQIQACALEAIAAQQINLDRTKNAAEQNAAELLNNLALRLGRERLSTLRMQQSYLPEESFSFVELKVAREKQTSQSAAQSIVSEDQILERPPYILADPAPLSALALLPDSPPAWIRWNGKQHKIVKARGPEKIAHEWWHTEIILDDAGERHYFKIQDESGLWLWVYRDKTLDWFLHGIWI